jgi:hypothetical protein
MEILELKKRLFELNNNLQMREVMAKSEETVWTNALADAQNVIENYR